MDDAVDTLELVETGHRLLRRRAAKPMRTVRTARTRCNKADALEDEVDLLQLARTREEGLPFEHLGDDAAVRLPLRARPSRDRRSAPDTPHVDRSTVDALTETELRWSIPPGDDLASVRLCSAIRERKLKRIERTHPVRIPRIDAASETKVGDHESTGVVDKQVRRLQVSMQDRVLRVCSTFHGRRAKQRRRTA